MQRLLRFVSRFFALPALDIFHWILLHPWLDSGCLWLLFRPHRCWLGSKDCIFLSCIHRWGRDIWNKREVGLDVRMGILSAVRSWRAWFHLTTYTSLVTLPFIFRISPLFSPPPGRVVGFESGSISRFDVRHRLWESDASSCKHLFISLEPTLFVLLIDFIPIPEVLNNLER